MRIALLIKDLEYRDALVQNLAESGSEILLDIVSAGEKIESDALILTDAKPADVDGELLLTIKNRIIFLTTCKSDKTNDNTLHTLFKYSSVSRLLADISDIYYRWMGIESHNAVNSRLIACCTDSDAFSDSRCTRVARQIIYRQGGSVLIMPLGYINEHSSDYSRDINNFARLMYKVRKSDIGSVEHMSYTDSFGISRLIIPEGRNPIAYLDEDDLSALILALSGVFETLILEVAGCYRSENLSAIKNAHSVICFETGRRRIRFEELLPKEESNKLRIIKVDEGSDEDPAIDEYIEELYGSSNEDWYFKG